jgi:hypothetical protein
VTIKLDTKAKHVVIKFPCTAKRLAEGMDELHFKWWVSLTKEEQDGSVFGGKGPQRPVQPRIDVILPWGAIVNGKMQIPYAIAFHEGDREEIQRAMKAQSEPDLESFRAFQELGEQELAASEAKRRKAAVIRPRF